MAAEQNRPASPDKAPDPAHTYERAKPEREAGMGSLDSNADGTPHDSPDRQDQTVPNRQDPSHQLNADDAFAGRDKPKRDNAAPPAEQPDHSMHDEEPDGWDQAPTDISDNRQKRHPRTEGRGGTP
jgi:hypothetical protein